MTKKTYFVLDYNELDKIIEDNFGYSYESIQQNEWNNYSCYTFNVKKNQKMYDWDIERLEQHIAPTCLLLNVLADRGILEEGDYLVNVSW